MDKGEAEILAKYYMDLYGLSEWTFRWNKNKTMLGVCRYDDLLIEMSEVYVSNNSTEHVTETILHEVAHALSGRGTGHGPRWKVVAARVGATPKACSKDAVLPQGRWQAPCPGCARVFHFHRKPKYIRRRYCIACGPEQGKLNFKDTQPVLPGARASRRQEPVKLEFVADDWDDQFDPAIVFTGADDGEIGIDVSQLRIEFPV